MNRKYLRTFEGTMTIKWWRNDNGDMRPLTIDCEDRISLKIELDRIKESFLTIGEGGRVAFSVKFQLTERL